MLSESILKWCLFILYMITSVTLILRVRSCVRICTDTHYLAIDIALCFFGLTVPISIYHTCEHLSSFARPLLQSQVVRILWMIPVFSTESLLSTIWVDYAFCFQAFREIYEAYVIYCFMRYLLHFLGDERYLMMKLSALPPSMGFHKPPFCFLTPWQMGQEFLRRCKAGVFQFVVVRLALTVISVILHFLGLYEEGNYSFQNFYIWSVIINCISQSWALYSLFLFYHCSQKELASIRPFYKFLSIKLVIFFSWWQALCVEVLIQMGHINSRHGHSAQQIATLVEDLLICVEMFIASIAFYFAFPVSDFAHYGGQGSAAYSRVRIGNLKSDWLVTAIEVGDAYEMDPELLPSNFDKQPISERHHQSCDVKISNTDNKLSHHIDDKFSLIQKKISNTTSHNELNDGIISTQILQELNKGNFISTNQTELTQNLHRQEKEDNENNSAREDNSNISLSNGVNLNNYYEDDTNNLSPTNRSGNSNSSASSSKSSNDITNCAVNQTNIESIKITGSKQKLLKTQSNSPQRAIRKVSPNTHVLTHYPQRIKDGSKLANHSFQKASNSSLRPVYDDDDDSSDSSDINSPDHNASSSLSVAGDHKVTGKGYHISYQRVRDQPSVLQALWASTLPAELQEDLSDLGAQMVEGFITQPYLLARKLIKGTSGHS